jgi:glycine cleavage system H protein
MSNAYPKELRYSSTHEWVRIEDNHTVTVGITDHAQHLLGDLVFVELPKLHQQTVAGKEIAVVESVKAAADVYSPLSGTILAVNETLQDAPGTVNSDPYGAGWLFRLQITDQHELEKLLDASKYQALIAAQG